MTVSLKRVEMHGSNPPELFIDFENDNADGVPLELDAERVVVTARDAAGCEPIEPGRPCNAAVTKFG